MLKATVRPIHGGSNGDFFILEVESDQHIQLDKYSGNKVRCTVYQPTIEQMREMARVLNEAADGMECPTCKRPLDKAHEMC